MGILPCIKILLLLSIKLSQGEEITFDRQHIDIEDISNITIPSNTTVILFNNNKIKEVPCNVLENLPNLREFHLHRNLISIIERQAFINVSSLRILYLNHNKLTHISKQMFRGLRNLRRLYLGKNLISHIGNESFVLINNLRILKLSQNRIRCISKLLFIGLSRIKELHIDDNEIFLIENQSFGMMNNLEKLFLQGNNLESLSESIFEGISQAGSITLSLYDNPLQCVSRWCWIRNDKEPYWVNLTHPEDTYCNDTESLHSHAWSFEFLLDHDLLCGGEYW